MPPTTQSMPTVWDAFCDPRIWCCGVRARFIGKASPSHFFGAVSICAAHGSAGGALRRERASSRRKSYSMSAAVSAGARGGDVADRHSMLIRLRSRRVERAASASGRRSYQAKLREFVLMYDDVRRTASPRDQILEFAQSTYEREPFWRSGIGRHSSGNARAELRASANIRDS